MSGTLPSKLKPKNPSEKGNCCRISLSRGYPGCGEPQSQAALNEPISGCSASALVGWQERSIRWDDESPGCYSDRELKAAGPSPSPSPFAKAKPQARLGRCHRWVLSTRQGLFPRVKSPACMEYEAAGRRTVPGDSDSLGVRHRGGVTKPELIEPWAGCGDTTRCPCAWGQPLCHHPRPQVHAFPPAPLAAAKLSLCLRFSKIPSCLLCLRRGETKGQQQRFSTIMHHQLFNPPFDARKLSPLIHLSGKTVG